MAREISGLNIYSFLLLHFKSLRNYHQEIKRDFKNDSSYGCKYENTS